MKSKTQKYLAVLTIFSLSMTGTAINSFASPSHIETRYISFDRNKEDHNELAQKYLNLAEEMQAKVNEHEENKKQKPSSNSFGKNVHNIEKHLEFRVSGKGKR